MTTPDQVITEARTWLRTPFHSCAQVKGAGVDCVHLLRAVYVATGAVAPFDIPPYPPDWFMHRDEERILLGLERCGATLIDAPRPGDIAVYKYGRCFSHLAIVVEWPTIIHAFYGARVVEEADGDAGELKVLSVGNHARARRFYRVLP